MTYIEHAHSEYEKYEEGVVEITVSYSDEEEWNRVMAEITETPSTEEELFNEILNNERGNQILDDERRNKETEPDSN